ncbi:MAG: BON domain-containing protein [Noviherbaspirillum sp.]
MTESNAALKPTNATGWRRLRRPLALFALCGLTAISLQGCIEMAVGTAVMGTIAATDRRTFGAQTEDKAIAVKGENRISNMLGSSAQVNINSFNRKVLLTGEVPDEAAKTAVEREIAAISGVQSIVNDLVVAPPTSFSARSNDTLLTGKVKASLIDAQDISANSFKVVTERGVVYLMGRVTQREGTRASEVARGVAGVQKVVKVFEYISDDEMRQMSSTPSRQ